MSEPRRDPFLTTLGDDVEDLSRVAPAQARASAGSTLSREGFELLRRSAAGDRRVRGLGAGEVGQLDRLVAAGLLDAKGRLTDPGLRVTGTLAQPQGQLHVDAAVGRISFSCQAFLRGDHAVVVGTASPQPWSGSDPDAEQVVALADTVTIDDVPVGYLPGPGPLGRAGNPRVTGPSPFFGWTADSLRRRACDQSCAGMPFSGRGR